jgi:hypothetical protein
MSELTFPIPRGYPARQRLNIYQLAPPRVTEVVLRDFATRFGLAVKGKSTTIQYDATRISLIDGSRVVTLYRDSGGLRYQDRSRWQIDDGRSNVKLSDAGAIDAARAYVRRLNLAPLKDCDVLKVSRLHVGSTVRDGDKRDERVIDVGVVFRRKIDGVRVDGPGGMVVVYLDQNAEVTGVDRIWRERTKVLRPVRSLRSIESVASEVARVLDTSLADRVEVRDLRFGYFEYGWCDSQPSIQPAFVALLTLYSADARCSPAHCVRDRRRDKCHWSDHAIAKASCTTATKIEENEPDSTANVKVLWTSHHRRHRGRT